VNIDIVGGKRKRRGRPEMKWEGEVKRVMQQNLTPDEAVKWQIRRKATEN